MQAIKSHCLGSLQKLPTLVKGQHTPQARYLSRAQNLKVQSTSSMSQSIQIAEPGGVDKLQLVNVPKPTPGANQVLVKNTYAGVNYIDTYHRSGLYPVALPFTIGVDGGGVVEAVGEGVDSVKPGQTVVYAGGSGSYAEYTLAPATNVIEVPEGVGLEEAVAAMVQGLTAVSLVTLAHKVEAGQWVLVHAAAGGTGQIITQVAASKGAHVIGTTSTKEKAELAKAAGAEHVILYSEQDVAAEVDRITGGKGVAVVYDGVGKSTFESGLKSLALLGTLVSFGNASGKVPPIDLLALVPRNVKVMRPSLFEYFKASPTAFKELAGETLGLIKEGVIKVRIHATYPLAEAAKAHEELEGRKTTGKILLTL